MTHDDHRTDGTSVDDRLRAFHGRALRDREDEVDQIRRRSRGTNRVRLHLDYSEVGDRTRRVRLLAVAVALAVALLAGIALAPGDRSDRPAGTLTPSASAAEVLESARVLLLQSGTTAGTGEVWHGVSRTYRRGELVSVNEQWFDSASDRNLLVAWGRDRTREERDLVSHLVPWAVEQPPVRREVLLIDRVDADGAQRLRRFERPAGEDWAFPPGDLDPTRAMDLPAGGADRQRQLANAMRDWLASVSAPDATTDELRAATLRFTRTTPDFFSAQPEWDVPRVGGAFEPSDAEEANFERLQETVPVRQMVYLLTTVQATPEAAAELYELIGRSDALENLGEVEIDSRRANRLRFDFSDPAISPHRERVLVLDAESGRILRTETLERDAWTEIEPARRVQAIGDDAGLCDPPADVPCALLDGEGAVAEQADRFAHDMLVRYAAHRQNRRNVKELGDSAPPLLCRKMSPYGTCRAQGPEEAARLEEIARDEAALRAVFMTNNATARLSDDSAHSTNLPLASLADRDGVWRSQGQCFRDWRVLTICRG